MLNVEIPSFVVHRINGSGKTKVLTSKLAYLVDKKKAWPNQILLLTFTNKAAKEMRDRVIKILGSSLNSKNGLKNNKKTNVRFIKSSLIIGLKIILQYWI